MRKNIKLLGAVAVAGVVAASGSAFTNSNTGAGTLGQVGGYNAASVSGVDVDNVAYAYSSDRATLDTVAYSLAGVTTLDVTSIAEVSTDGGTTWDTCETRLAAADDIVCNVNAATAGVTSMHLVVRADDSTPAV